MYSSSPQGVEFELEHEVEDEDVDDDFEEEEEDDDSEGHDNAYELADHEKIEVGMQWEFLLFNRTLFYDPILALSS
jgi:hypothetical protein